MGIMVLPKITVHGTLDREDTHQLILLVQSEEVINKHENPKLSWEQFLFHIIRPIILGDKVTKA